MKKILNLLLLGAATLLYTGCTPEVEDVFPKSSAQRIEESIASTQKTLQGSANGWLMRMYGDLDFGGYNVLCKFEGDHVTVMNELYGSQQTTKSHYRVDQSAGVVLSFDEYNEQFHFFSEPKNALGWGFNGKGFLGDLEFRVLKATADSIVMTGKKHNNRIVMTPAPADWSLYLETVKAMEKSIVSANYALKVGDMTMATTNSYRCFQAVDPKTGFITKLPYMVTDKGVELYKSYTLNGKNVKAFDCTTGDVWPELSDQGSSLYPVIIPLNEQLVNGKWSYVYSGFGATAKLYWDEAAKNLLNVGSILYVAELGTQSVTSAEAPRFGLYFSCMEERAWPGQLVYGYKLTDTDMIEITGPTEKLVNGDWYFKRGMNYISKTIEGTFKLTTDNIRNPSYLIMTSTKDPEMSLKLVKNRIYYPMSK